MFRDLRFSLPLLAAAAWACSGGQTSGGSSSLQVKPTPLSVPADGLSAITLQITAVGVDGNPYNGDVSLTSSKQVVYGDGMVEDDTISVIKGSATQTLTCTPGTDCVGTVIINGSLASNGANANSRTQVTFTGVFVDGGNGTTGTTGGTGGTGGTGSTGGTGGSGSTTGAPSVPGQIKALASQHPYMGIDYKTGTLTANFPENTFFFEVDDNTGKIPVPNVPVVFAAGASNAQGSYVVSFADGGFQALTDSLGQVSVQGHSGQKTGPFTVTATVVGTDFSADGTSSVVGTQPSLSNSTLTCSPFNLAVYIGNNPPCETTSPVEQQTVCYLNLADRFNYVVQVPIAVQFFTEAGNFMSPTVQTPAYGSASGVPGQATNTLLTNSKLPEDVDPWDDAGEPSYVAQCASAGSRTYNPRDGLVTIIAVFQGEEGFLTSNGSGIYQLGDSFTDIPQPFVDSNDSSVFDPDEFCAGISDGGICLGPNGQWDANTNVFVETRVLYTGSAGPNTITFSDPGASAGYVMAEGQSKNGTVLWADVNLNYPAASTVYSVVKSSGPSGF
jgi:hypothetical protein